MYKVYDGYEGLEFLERAKDLSEVKKIAKQRYYDTDGECSILYGTDKNNLNFLKTF